MRAAQELFGKEAADPSIAKLIWAVNLGFYVLCNILFVLAIIYSLAVMSLLIWPHSLIKVLQIPAVCAENSTLLTGSQLFVHALSTSHMFCVRA